MFVSPNGTLIANSHGHGSTARMKPPIVGPAAALVATTSALSPSARPSCARGKMSRRIAGLIDTIADAPIP